MDSRYQFGATVVVWISYAVIMVALFMVLLFGRADLATFAVTAPLFTFLMFLTAVAAYATRAIWRGAGTTSAAQGRESLAAERQSGEGKAKRRQAERLQALIEQLDEDEIVEMETLLMSRGDDDLAAGRGRR